MPDGVVFLYGSLGGAIATLLLFVVPPIVDYIEGDDTRVTRGRVLAIAAMLIILAAVGGVVALMVGADKASTAIAAGVGSLGTLKGGVAAGKQVIKSVSAEAEKDDG